VDVHTMVTARPIITKDVRKKNVVVKKKDDAEKEKKDVTGSP
jgi:hypothetical protein